MSEGLVRVLVLGKSGMFGHKVSQILSETQDVWTTLRGEADAPKTIGGVRAEDFATVEAALRAVRPQAVVNCVGIIKQQAEAKDPVPCIAVNALFPHLLANACAAQGIRLVHISTDCVFDGRKGAYVESDPTNAEDLYGRSKAMGEVVDGPHLTLRTSIVGRELRGGVSLVEWILAQNGGTVKGYTRALFSGLTTLELARVVRDVVLPRPGLKGLYHVSADPIAKHDLVRLVADAYGLDLRIVPSDEVAIDRTLDSRRFREATGYRPPSWPEMIAAMARDSHGYRPLTLSSASA